jgi:hypothetical protein
MDQPAGQALVSGGGVEKRLQQAERGPADRIASIQDSFTHARAA